MTVKKGAWIESGNKRVCDNEFDSHLVSGFRRLYIFKSSQEEIRDLSSQYRASSTFGPKRSKYGGDRVFGRIEINFNRVAIWALIFTNTFFVSFFFARLFRWIWGVDPSYFRNLDILNSPIPASFSSWRWFQPTKSSPFFHIPQTNLPIQFLP